MFFALKGPNFNANAFAAKAIEQGCRYAVADDASLDSDDRFIVVPDVLLALQSLARHHRMLFQIPVIAITGTNGKTTTKELVHAVLEADRPTLATVGNLNNHIGVPITLLRLEAGHRCAVIEMGANKLGDIAELCSIAQPTHGLITNIGKAHLEGFGSEEGVVRTKTELYEHLRNEKGGEVLVNADDDLLMEKSEGLERRTYGTEDNAGIKGRLLSEGAFLTFSFKYQGDHTVRTRLIGDYNLPNALAAICVGLEMGVPVATVIKALETYTPGNNRSQFTDTGRNQLVLDAYNANPSSMQAALRNFASMKSGRPKLALLGGMKELGAYSNAEHQALVDLADSLDLEIILIGPEFNDVRTGSHPVHRDVEAALDALKSSPVADRLILIKGSRGTKLELLLPAL